MRRAYQDNIRRRIDLTLTAKIQERNVFPVLRSRQNIGWGFDIADIHDFEPDDDPADIDIGGLAAGELNIIEHYSFEEVPIVIFVDVSPSMTYWSNYPQYSKAVIRDIAAGLLLFSAKANMNAVSMVLFQSVIKKVFAAGVGEYARHLFDELLSRDSSSVSRHTATMLSVIEYMRRFPDSMICFISDFQSFDARDANWSALVAGLDVVPIIIRDPMEKFDFGGGSYLLCRDPEGGREKEIFVDKHLQQEMWQSSERFYQELTDRFSGLHIAHVSLDTADVEVCYKELERFFAKRLGAVLR